MHSGLAATLHVHTQFVSWLGFLSSFDWADSFMATGQLAFATISTQRFAPLSTTIDIFALLLGGRRECACFGFLSPMIMRSQGRAFVPFLRATPVGRSAAKPQMVAKP